MTLVGCKNKEENIESNDTRDPQILQVYAEYKSNGGNLSYDEWLESIKGEKGDTGDTGPQGEPGKDGSSILTGNGAPTPLLGNNGDSYIDLDSWDFWTKINENWVKQGNIKGVQGEPGEDGLSIVSIQKSLSDGLIDYYTITYSNDTTYTFTINNETFSAMADVNNINYLYGQIIKTDKTASNINFKWNEVTSSFSVTGTASSTTFCDFVKCNLPNGMKPGGIHYVRFVTDDTNVDMRIIFKDSNSNIINTQIFNKDGYVYVPTNAASLVCRLFVSGGKTVNAIVSQYSIYRYKPEYLNEIYTHGCPKIIVFKDDDTANDEAIQRYRDACLHNGVVGSYATVADRITRNSIDVNKLLRFEQEGFTVMCHCNEHATYWRSGSFDAQSQREDMAKVIRTMRESGFINYMYWQTPFGSVSEDILHLCRSYGFKALGTKMYANSVADAYSHIENLSRYNLVSYSMKETDASGYQTLGKAKELIDMFASSNGGVLVLTTHFADWKDLTWDSTLDENGYPIGYERFNELVQYSKSSGCQIMNFADAVAAVEPYYID